uniref:Uncharacterized protein n=1 Tax=Arundo donax TaxID=35708 RepID=A0A0A9BTG4_ARUDO
MHLKFNETSNTITGVLASPYAYPTSIGHTSIAYSLLETPKQVIFILNQDFTNIQ